MGCSCQIVPVPLPQSEMQGLISQFQQRSLTVMSQLEKFNSHQQAMILKHSRKEACKLLYVVPYRRKKLASVLGDLDITFLMWITQPTPQVTSSTGLPVYLPTELTTDSAFESDEDAKPFSDGKFVIYVKTCTSGLILLCGQVQRF